MVRKKEMKRSLGEEIKMMELKKREESINKVRPEQIKSVDAPSTLRKVSFDTWYFMRSKSIPARHAKEIIIADFKARGLRNEETIETFDRALNRYGVRL